MKQQGSHFLIHLWISIPMFLSAEARQLPHQDFGVLMEAFLGHQEGVMDTRQVAGDGGVEMVKLE